MSRSVGLLGEERAAEYLKSQGWRVIERNFYSKLGEVDIIAITNRNTLVFCEVKTYTDKSWVAPISAITKRKQRNLIKTAQYYLLKTGYEDIEMRFDALVVTSDKVEHFENIIQLSE